MKSIYLSICIMLILSCINLPVSSQQAKNKRYSLDLQTRIPKKQGAAFLKAAAFPDQSFYQRKSEWKHIIDTTWGPGATMEEKLYTFNTYAKTIHDKFDGMQSLNWDSIFNHYLLQITDSTSKGAFASIMEHFAYELKDKSTYANDTTVTHTAPDPGIPVFFIGNLNTYEHFGAATTVLDDSTTLILRVAPNHPLNLKPGDIILGYEGVPWPELSRELFNAGLPMIGTTSGIKSSETYHRLKGAEQNWHLFSTIDILQYASGDTLHLSLEPMAGYEVSETMKNEQLPIPNIPFPEVTYTDYNMNFKVTDTLITYGLLENTNIGYIFLSGYAPVATADKQFYEAIDSLKNTDALIIDMRINFGGDAFLNKGFDVLFNENIKTIQDAQRCNPNTWELCPLGNWSEFQTNGKYSDYYDRPIAILMGPSNLGMGELNAYRLSYHPMVRFFGKSSAGSIGLGMFIDKPGWELRYSYTDMYQLNNPGTYLNRKEFPIDYPVWFNKDDVAKGIDPIVEKARQWINNLAFGHSLMLDKRSLLTEKDTIHASATIENPESHDLSAMLIIESLDSMVVDSTEMKQTSQNKQTRWQAHFTISDLPENYYWVSLKVEDKTSGTYFTNRHMTRFTTVPLIIDSLVVKKTADFKYSIQPYFKNEGDSVIIKQPITVTLTTNSWVKTISPKMAYSPILEPGLLKKTEAFTLTCDTASFQSHFDLKFSITSQEWPYWVLDTTIAVTPTSIEADPLLPLTNALNQNYPNPFNDQTTIKWQLAKGNRASLSVFNILGSKVATLLDEYRPAGKYETILNAATLPKGIYFYQLKAGQFIQTKKMIVVK